MQKETLFQRLLNYYHMSKEEYLLLNKKFTEEDFTDGHYFKNMENATSLVEEAMSNHEKILIYGDYDADGVMGTSILYKAFLLRNYQVSYYVPNRYHDGYGITLMKAQEAVKNGFGLVICVDNGVSAFDAIDYLKAHNVKVLVIDHHTIQERIVSADVIIHPQYSEFGDIATSGAFTAFMFTISFLGYFDKYLSTLAAISIISDMMPIKGYNHHFLRLVFSKYQEGEFPSIDILKEEDIFDENSIGLKIAPKINAVGRLIDNESINDLVQYFVTTDKDQLYSLATWITDINLLRKNESKILNEKYLNLANDEPATVINSSIKEGLIGLVANGLCSSNNKPTIVFTPCDDQTILKGSARAPEGFNVVDCFNELSDLLLTSGGHPSAGGCSIKSSDFDLFKKRFIAYTSSHPVVKTKKEAITLYLTEINANNYALIKTFAPFGEGYKAPIFVLPRIMSSVLTFSKTGEHILYSLGMGTKIVGFNFSKTKVNEQPFISLTGTLRSSVYRGYQNIEFVVKSIDNPINN